MPKSEGKKRKERKARAIRRYLKLEKDYYGPRNPPGFRKHELAAKEKARKEADLRKKLEEKREEEELALAGRTVRGWSKEKREYEWNRAIAWIEARKTEKRLQEQNAAATYAYLAAQPIEPPWHALLDGPDPKVRAPRVIGKNYFAVKNGKPVTEVPATRSVNKLPDGDLQVHVPTTPSTEEDCVNAFLDEQPVLPPQDVAAEPPKKMKHVPISFP